MIMRKYVLVGLISLVGLAAKAQDEAPEHCYMKGPHHMRHMPPAEKRVDMMTKELNLTDAEKAKVLELFKAQDVKMKAKMEEFKKEREKRKAEFEAERKVQDAELQKIIGAEKFQKFEIIRNHEKLKRETFRTERDSMKHKWGKE
jgi:Spy/CpxP family protein refolding chaperone